MTRSGIWLSVFLASCAWPLPTAVRTAFAVDRSEGAPSFAIDTGPAGPRDHSVHVEPSHAESDHFVVSYYTLGSDSLFRPDLPTILLEDLEYAYRVLSTDPRSTMHVPLGTYAAAGRTRKILVQIQEVQAGYSGFAYYKW